MTKVARKGMLAFAIVFAMIAVWTAAAGAVELKQEWKDNPTLLWNEIRNNWDNNVETYTCDILGWAYRTEHYIKNIGDNPDEDEDWVYRLYQVKFKQPNWVLFSYSYSAHEKNTESENLIDKAVAYVLKYTEGTTFNYGYKGTDVAYIKFPYISNKDLKAIPIPTIEKLKMKGLMILSRNEIYQRPLDELRDPRGYSVDNLIIGLTMDRFTPMFKQVSDPAITITAETSPRFGQDDYDIDEETGWLTLKSSAAGKAHEVIKLTLIDTNEARTKGINKYEAFVNPADMMFVGLHEFENDKLVGVSQFFNMEVNVDLPEKLWNEDYFENRNINADK